MDYLVGSDMKIPKNVDNVKIINIYYENEFLAFSAYILILSKYGRIIKK